MVGGLGQQVEGKAHGHLEGLVVPLGTLDERVQQLLLATRLEVAVVHRGVPGEVQDLEALVDVGPVGGLVALDVLENLLLLRPPLVGATLEVRSSDRPVELVLVHAVEALLDETVFRLEALDGLGVEARLVLVARLQRVDQPLVHLVREPQPVELTPEALVEDLLARVPHGAGPAAARAVVVHVLALLDLRGQLASASGAADQA